MPEGTIPPPPDTSRPAPSPGGGIGGWVSTHKGYAAAGGIFVVALVYYLYRKHQQNVAAASTGGASTSAAGTSASPGTGYDTTGYGYYPYSGGYGGTMDMSTLASTLAAQESQIAANSTLDQQQDRDTTPATTPGATKAPVQAAMFKYGKISGPQATADIQKGVPIYYDPQVPMGKGPVTLTTSTPLPLWHTGISNVDEYQQVA